MYESGITVVLRGMININSDSPHSPADRSQSTVDRTEAEGSD